MRNWKIMDLRNSHLRESKWLLLNQLTIRAKSQPLFRLLVIIQPLFPQFRLLVIIPMTLQSQFQPSFQTSVIRNCIKPDEPPQSVATSHLKDPISTTTNLDEACSLDTSSDLLHHLNSPSLLSELQDNTSVGSTEIEFLPESEGQLDHTNISPTDVFSEHLDYELVLLQNEIDAPNDNPDHYDIHTCENQDDILIHATNLSNTLHYSNLLHNTTLNTRIPLMIQLQHQPLPKLQLIIPSNLSVLITQW